MAEATTSGLVSKAQQHIREVRLGKPHSATLRVDVEKGIITEHDLIFISNKFFSSNNIDQRSDEAHEHILVGEAYLRNAEIDPSVPENQIAVVVIQIRDWIINLISPSILFAPEAPYLAACLASFSNPHDPWTNEESFRLARLLISKHLALIKTTSKDFDTLFTNLLLDNIKPFFLKSKTSLLTPQARKAISPLPGPAAPSDFESGSKPWKFESPHIVTVFQWTLSQLEAELIEKQWPLIIPPLLTILDDVSIAYKIRGCELLDILLKATSSSLLERSGLGEIFHNTLLPYLLYLPTLTPEEESLPLLNATYNTLITLTISRFPPSSPSSTNPKRIKTLSAIFRYGILKSYTHIGEN
ncbi:MAG: hypothetical protein Q9224_006313, partial [Gallowayella concinna]